MSEISQATWAAVDAFLESCFMPVEDSLAWVTAANKEAGLPAIDVSPLQGQLLEMIAGLMGAKRILEVGTLGGYSTIWLARALPAGGKVVTLELDPKHADTARKNLARAGVADRVEVRVGPANDTLAAMRREGLGPFDLTFIDADKVSTPVYYEHALALSRPGSLIIVDNVIRHGEVANPNSKDSNALAMRAFVIALGKDRRVTPAAVPMAGVKGYDGMVMARVR